MNSLNSNLLSGIICIVGSWPDVLKLQQVCKRWKKTIEEAGHFFTMQGSRIPFLIPSNSKIESILERFKGSWKLESLDLRNVNISVDLLAEVLMNQRGLKKLDLSNTALSVGQVWSHMQANKNKETLLLEELRITNNRTVYLGYEALASVYPNLIKLYAGNTLTILDNLKVILLRFPKLQLLDVSLCNIDYYDMVFIDFRELLQSSDLRKIFISEINETVLEILLSCEVEVVETTIGDILLEVNNEESLYMLDDWLRIGGDVNLMCNISHKLCKTIGIYPQLHAIKRITDETLLRDTFKILISYNLDLSLHSPEENGNNLINSAILANQTGLVHLLVSCGCDISPCYSGPKDEEPALKLAARLGDISIFQIFLDFKLCEIDYYSPNHCNPICAASASGNKDMFIFLIEQGVPLFFCPVHPNILISNKDILELALSEEYKNIFTFPLEMLYEAAQYYISKRNIEEALFIIQNLDPTVKEEEANLLANRRGSSLKISSDMHKPLIVLATEKRIFPIVKYLVENGFDINGEDMHGWTAFICASSYGYQELIPYLCENGALVNKRDSWWRTALHQASQNGHTEIVVQLIKYGASLSPACDKGLTPLNYAIINRRTDIAALLRSHGAEATKLKPRCTLF